MGAFKLKSNRVQRRGDKVFLIRVRSCVLNIRSRHLEVFSLRMKEVHNKQTFLTYNLDIVYLYHNLPKPDWFRQLNGTQS